MNLKPIIMGMQGSFFDCLVSAMISVGVRGAPALARNHVHTHTVTSLAKMIGSRELLENQVPQPRGGKAPDRL